MEDEGIRRLVKDIKKLLRKGTPLDDIAASIQHLEDAASTRLTVEERTVLLKHIEKKERKWRGPKRGLESYNKRMRKFQLPGAKKPRKRQYTTKHQRQIPEAEVASMFVHQIRSLFNKFKNGEIHYSDAMRQVDELTKDRHDADKWRAALHSLRNVNEGQVDTIRLTKLRNLVETINRALESAYVHSDANDAKGYYAALNSADKHIEAYVRKHGSGRITEAKYVSDWYTDEELARKIKVRGDMKNEFFEVVSRGGPRHWINDMNKFLREIGANLRVTDARDADDYIEWQVATTANKPF